MGKIRSYRDLQVWQKSMDFAVEVHTLTRGFPKEELFLLTAQLRKSSISVPSNIAEGHGRRSTRHYVRFLAISRGSINEAETQLTLAERYDYISPSLHDGLIEKSGEIGRMLNGLIDSLENPDSSL